MKNLYHKINGSFILIAISCLLYSTECKSQLIWHELKGPSYSGLHGYIDGGPVRALFQDTAAGILWLGGEFDIMKDPVTPGWNFPLPSLMKWGYSPLPNGIFQWWWLDNCDPSSFHPEFLVRSISCIIDSSILYNYMVFGGYFNYLDCSFPADPSDSYAWNLGTNPPPSLSSGYDLAHAYMTFMDTVFAVSTVQGAHCMQAQPRFITYVAAKCTFCLVDSSNYDTTRYIASFIPSRNCVDVDSFNYMQGGSNGPVYAITAIDTSEVYAGGTFDSAGVIKANNIARWNGTNWDSLGGGVNGTVKAILRFNNQIYAGGTFTMAGGIPANNIARWDGAQWWPVGTGTNGAVYALTSHNGELCAGGAFTQAGGNTANHVARWDGTNWTDVGGGRNDDVYALASYFGELYAGGKFSGGAGDTIKWIARYGDLATGVSAYYNAQNGIQVYPNPAHSMLYIENISNDAVLSVYDYSGRLVINSKVTKTLDISQLSNGVYCLKVTDGKGIGVKRFVKE